MGKSERRDQERMGKANLSTGRRQSNEKRDGLLKNPACKYNNQS